MAPPSGVPPAVIIARTLASWSAAKISPGGFPPASLAEIDGPMLQHGPKDMDGRRIDVPRAERLRPNRDYLAERFERFRAA